jgi:alpha-ketoglutaric semialdehyde dehydrogenase
MQITGQHLINGAWISGNETFQSSPASGPAYAFSVGTPADIDAAALAAEAAFPAYSALSREIRAQFLEEIAAQIDARGDQITAAGISETGLPEARLVGERGRTTGQLRLFAAHIRKLDYLNLRHDAALPVRAPLPRPDIRMMQQPIGPVAVFGASNFPLAFSVMGGDSASALAAGCPVVVKGHSAHPATGEVVARAVLAAIEKMGLPKGVFSLVQGGRRDVGEALVRHPLIRAVGFTGSLAGGRALFDLCAARPDPIPFFGELGSVNPMFVLPAALAARGAEIASGWAASLTLGAGQFCTNPGIGVVIESGQVDTFIVSIAAALEPVLPQIMLTDGIADAYRAGAARIADAGAKPVMQRPEQGRRASPYLYQVTGDEFLANPHLAEEVFGPLGLIIRAKDKGQMQDIARALQGQLTCTLHLDAGDTPLAQSLMPILTRKAGRILANGFPTGVEVCDAMVHGGPYPASTNFGATSVGTMSIRRWLRPIAYQNLPPELLPIELRTP